MQGAPAKIDVQTKDEEVEIDWPPYIFMMQLDGTLKWYQFFNTQWIGKSLLSNPGQSIKSNAM